MEFEGKLQGADYVDCFKNLSEESVRYKEIRQKIYGYQSNQNLLTSRKNIFPNQSLRIDQNGQKKEVYPLTSDFGRQYEKSMLSTVTGLPRRNVEMEMQQDLHTHVQGTKYPR